MMSDTRLKTYYISGPMRGIERYNFPEFDSCRDYVQGLGFGAVSPADHDREVEPNVEFQEHFRHGDPTLQTAEERHTFPELIGWDLRMIASPEVDGIILIDGWEASTGAQHERYVAEATNKEVWIAHHLSTGGWFMEEDPERSLSAKRGNGGYDHTGRPLAPVPAGITTDRQERKDLPITTGVLDYFPDALLEVARVSKIGNDQHNPGEPLHWAKEKSTDEPDALVRHLLERGTFDTDGTRHSSKVAWRALALLQREMDAAKLASQPYTGGEV